MANFTPNKKAYIATIICLDCENNIPVLSVIFLILKCARYEINSLSIIDVHVTKINVKKIRLSYNQYIIVQDI